jgi:hypothetical protein
MTKTVEAERIIYVGASGFLMAPNHRTLFPAKPISWK